MKLMDNGLCESETMGNQIWLYNFHQTLESCFQQVRSNHNCGRIFYYNGGGMLLDEHITISRCVCMRKFIRHDGKPEETACNPVDASEDSIGSAIYLIPPLRREKVTCCNVTM